MPWTVVVRTTNGDEEQFEYELIGIATGLFTNPSYMPHFPGQRRLGGSILHASALKSALADENAISGHMVFRLAHWLIRRHLLSEKLPYRYASTRVLFTVFDPYPKRHRSAL